MVCIAGMFFSVLISTHRAKIHRMEYSAYIVRVLTLLPSYTMELDIKTISEPARGICEELQILFLYFALDDTYNLNYDIRKLFFCKSSVARLKYHI